MKKRSKSEREPAGLFFDGGGSVGWALMGIAPSTPLLRFDSFTTPTGDTLDMMGRRLLLTERICDALVLKLKPDLIGFESPFVPMPVKNPRPNGTVWSSSPAVIRFLISIAGIFELVATRHGIPCKEVNTGTMKAAFAGHGRAEKIEVKRACWARGWEVLDEHQADACGVGWTIIRGILQERGHDFSVDAGEPTAGRSIRSVAEKRKPQRGAKVTPLII